MWKTCDGSADLLPENAKIGPKRLFWFDFRIYVFDFYIAGAAIQLILQPKQNLSLSMDYMFFYQTYHQRMLSYAQSYLPDHIAEDAVQDVFLTLWEHRSDLDRYDNLPSYAFQSVKNRCLDYMRSIAYRRSHEVLVTQEELVRTCSVVNNTVLRWMDRVEVEYHTNIAVRRMGPRCRMVFQMCMLKGMTRWDVAECLGLSANTVDSQMRIAMHTVRRVFAAAAS